MIENLVRYLHAARIPFRLASYPSEERQPKAAHPIPAGGMLVETELLVLDGRPVLACFPAGEAPDLAAVGAALGGLAVVGTSDELPDDLRYAEPPIPPLGQLFGLPLVVDERVTRCSLIVFASFGESDFFEIPYEDFARLEQPRVAAFASAGELIAHRP
jgi:Ala-tRNA(Pro) deacylase